MNPDSPTFFARERQETEQTVQNQIASCAFANKKFAVNKNRV